MRLSVIIPTYNRREALASCLDTLLGQDLATSEYEIVVVIDGSTDGTRETLRAYEGRANLVVLVQPNQGQTAALNAGAQAASGRLLLFLDDDLLCDRHLLSSHLAAHDRGENLLVFGRMSSPISGNAGFGDTNFSNVLDRYYRRLLQDPGPKWPDDAWAGPNCSLPRAAFFAAGAYDQARFPRRGEDVDLGLRLWKRGLRFHFEPLAVTFHRFVKSEWQHWSDAEDDGRSMIALCRIHPDTRFQSRLSEALNAAPWKILLARVASYSHTLTRVAFGAAIHVLQRSKTETWRKLGFRLFLAREHLALLTGARREAGSWAKLTDLFRRRAAVLLYHHVGEPTPITRNLALSVTPRQFRRHLRWLKWRGYTPISSVQWLNWIRHAEPLPPKPVLLTFDDAYADIARNALPLLEKLGMRSIVFAITGRSGNVNSWDGLRLMAVAELQNWAARGVEIGAHTRTHPELTAIADREIVDEVAGSKHDLEDAGIRPASFAYPYGGFDRRVRDQIQGIFPVAFTCEEGLNDLQTDPWMLRRTMVQPGDTLLDIEFRAALGWSPLNYLRSRLRVRTRVRTALRYLKLLPQ